jgi:hypothetical protein
MVCVYFFKRLIFSCLNLGLSIGDWRPIICVFCEYYLSKSDAIRREQYFKTTAGKRVLRLMLQESLMLVAEIKKRTSFQDCLFASKSVTHSIGKNITVFLINQPSFDKKIQFSYQIKVSLIRKSHLLYI